MSKPEVIRVENVAKKFTVHKDKSLKERIVNFRRSHTHKEEYWALNDVSLSVEAGESLALAGPNGSGKSTLLKVIGGILTPNQGAVFTRGRLAALLELGAGFHPDLTGRENIFLNGAILGLSEKEILRQFDSIVDFSGIKDFIDTQVKFYSSGMYVRLAFAVAVHSDPDILLVDEVLAVGDEPFQNKCMEKIREFQKEGRSIILVSHSAQQVIDVCDRAAILDGGTVLTVDTSRQAMAFLHEYYQQQAREHAGIAEDSPANKASLSGIRILQGLAQNDDLAHYYRPGTPLQVAIDIKAPTGLDQCAIILNLETDRGQHVFGIDTRTLGLSLSYPSDGHAIFDLVDFFPGSGDFYFSAILLDKNGIEIDTIRNAVILPSRSSHPTHGFLTAGTSVRFVS